MKSKQRIAAEKVSMHWRELENGLIHIALVDPDAETTCAQLFAGLGDAKEKDGMIEVGHVGEHAFDNKNTIAQTLAHDAFLQDRNLEFDGETTRTYIKGQYSGPVEHRRFLANDKIVVRLLSERLSGFVTSPRPLRNDIHIVANEIRRRLSSDFEVLSETVVGYTYPGTRYARTYKESLASLQRITAAEVVNFQKYLFRTQNLTLVTHGPNDLVSTVEKHFEKLQRNVRDLHVYDPVLPPKRQFTEEIARKGAQTCFVEHSLRGGEPTIQNKAMLYLLEMVVSKGRCCYMQQEFQRRRGRSYEIDSDRHLIPRELRFSVQYTCEPWRIYDTHGHRGNMSLFVDMMAQLAKDPMGEEEFRRYQRYAVDDFVDRIGDQSRIGDWYMHTGLVQVYNPMRTHVDVTSHTQFIDMLESISPKQLQQAVLNLDPDKMGTVIFYPPNQRPSKNGQRNLFT